MRELTFLAEEKESWAARLKRSLLVMKHYVDGTKTAGETSLDHATIRRYERRYEILLRAGEAADPPPALPTKGFGRPCRTPAANMLIRLRKCWGSVLRFVYDFAVPFDNSEAERDLRMMEG